MQGVGENGRMAQRLKVPPNADGFVERQEAPALDALINACFDLSRPNVAPILGGFSWYSEPAPDKLGATVACMIVAHGVYCLDDRNVLHPGARVFRT